MFASLFLGVIVHYKLADTSSVADASTLTLAALSTSLLLGVIAVLLMVTSRHRAPVPRDSTFSMVAALVTCLLVIAAAELVLRVFVFVQPVITSQLPRGLLPRDWQEVGAVNRELLQQFSDGKSYLVPDEVLGWSIGNSRTSADELYHSSSEGIRSASRGISLRGSNAPARIAVVGDSYTFSEAVTFAESWAHQLELQLDGQFQVLNFGVPGYGVDQAYLRYETEVPDWQPEIVILGFIAHDLYRSLSVYTAITFPGWQFPFAKPRFDLQDGTLTLLNSPLPSPELLTGETTISELPLIDVEPGYLASDWQWRWYHSLYSVRFAISLMPNWPATADDDENSSLVAINAAILRRFVESARERRIKPIVVYFPSTVSGELDAGAAPPGIVNAVFAASGIDFFDATDCIRSHDIANLTAPDEIHYSPEANKVVAACLADIVRDLNDTAGTALSDPAMPIAGRGDPNAVGWSHDRP